MKTHLFVMKTSNTNCGLIFKLMTRASQFATKANSSLHFGKTAIAGLVVAFLLLGGGNAMGQLITEPFNYTAHATDGLAKQSSLAWAIVNTGDSILVTSGNLSHPGLPASTGNMIAFDGAGTDYNRSFTLQNTAGTTVYLSFVLKITSLGSLNTTGSYFTGLAASSSLFGAVVQARKSAVDGTKYNLGVSVNTSSAISWSSIDYTVGQEYFIVSAYQIVSGLTNDTAKLWINPALGAPTESAPTCKSAWTASNDLTGVSQVFLRQAAATTTPFIQMDEMRIGTSWTSVTPYVAGAPTITLSTNALTNFGSVQLGNSSAEQTYTVSASDLTDTLHITAPSPFEISLSSGSGFGSSLYLLPSAGAVGSTNIYVRFTPSANGTVSDSISNTSAGAITKRVGVSGTGSSCSAPNITPDGPTSFCTGGSVTLTADAGVSYLWSTSETTQSIVVTTSGNYTVAVTDGSNCTATSLPTTVTVGAFSFSGLIFSETMGTPTTNTFINAYTGWQNYGIYSFTSTTTNQSDVRTTTASAGYVGASGSGNVFMGTSGTSARDFIISGINTTGYTGLTLSFGMLRSLNTDPLIVSASTDGINYTPLTTSAQPAVNNAWGLVTVTSGIPATSNLRIKFEKSTANSFRIDDISLSGAASSVAISALGSTTICQGTTVTLISNIPTGNEWSPVFSFSQAIQVGTADTYYATVTDLNGCAVVTNSITVTVIDAPTVTTSTTDVLCSGDSTGTATAIPTGGAGGYTYSWNSNPVQTSVTASALPAGSYNVVVTDAIGCSGSASALIGEPLPLQVSASSTVPSSIGGNDGTATAVAFDGTPTYSYSWNTAPVQNTDVATGLMAGTYTVVATDANGCTASTQTVVVDPIPEITVSTTSLADFGNAVLGSSSTEDIYTVSGIYLADPILISAPAGFEVSLTSGSGFGSSVSLSPSLGVVPTTSVYVRFTPLLIGPASGSITHTSTGAAQKDVAVSGTGTCFLATITPSGPTSFCTGGSVTLTASSGASYLWSSGQTTQSILVTASGSFSVVISDGLGCLSTSPVEVVTVNSFSFTGIMFSENMGTPGGNTFVNNYTGWQNNGVYTYQSTLTNQSDVRTSTASTGYSGATGSGNVFMGTAGGTNPRDFIIGGINTTGYTNLHLSFGMLRTTTAEALAVSVSTDGITYSPITTTVQPAQNAWALVSDSIGTIPATSNLRIKFEKATSVSFRIDDISISGTTNTLLVTANGPTTICGGKELILTSNISVGNTWSPGLEFSQSLHITTSGTYYNTLTDINGCIETSPSFVVSVNPSPVVDTLISTNLLCNNDSSGAIEAIVSGGTTPYTYNWNTVPPQTSLSVTDLHAGYYTFTVTDINSCTASRGVLVTQPTPLVVSTSVIAHPSFIGATDGSIASTVTGGITPYNYSWNSVPVQTTDTAVGLGAGIYTLTVVDSNGCTVSVPDTLNDPLPEIFVSPNTLPAFTNTLVGNTSTEQSYTVSAIYLTDSILLVAPAGFEISLTSGSGFGDSLALYPSLGTVAPTTIYVHFQPLGGGLASDVITHTSVGAIQKDVAVSGTGVTCPQATITPGGPLTFCQGGSVTLTASSGVSYLWSNGQTTASISTDTSGTFSVIITDAFACSSTSAPTTVVVNAFGFNGAIFSEDMGNSGGTVALNTYIGWQNNGILNFSTNPVGPSDVRTSLGSSGYTGVSGFSNIFMGTSGGINPRNFIISGANTIGYSGMSLSFGMHRTAITEALAVEVSTDGINYTALTTSAQPVANTWALVTATGAIPNTASLYIRFSKQSSVSFRLDDVKLSGSTTTPVISPNGAVSICQGSQVKLVSNLPAGNVWTPGLEVTKSIIVTTANTYGLTVTDLNGCVASATPVTVTVNQIPVVSTTVTDVICNGAMNGTATANVSAGTAPFTYSWNTAPVQTTQTATGLAPGTYTVVVTGAIGCKDSATAVISEPTPIVSTCAVLNHVTCNGGSDGAVSVSASGGTGAITITGPATSGLAAGTYTYTFTDASNCFITCDLTITQPAAIVISGFTPNTGIAGTVVTISGSGFTGATDVQFNGLTASYLVDNDGQITATAPAGVSTGPITVVVGSCQVSSTGVFTVGSTAGVSVDLKLFLEGYYLGGSTMYSTLYDLEQGGMLTGPYTTDATDTIQVNLWTAASVALGNPDPDYSEKVILHNTGLASATFPTAPAGDYYIAVKHKNSIETWSSFEVTLASTAIFYDFSYPVTQAFEDGVNPPMKDVDGGLVFALYSGDVNQDGTVDGSDMNDVYNDNNLSLYDYLVTDCTGDGTADGTDMNYVYNNNNLSLFYARPY